MSLICFSVLPKTLSLSIEVGKKRTRTTGKKERGEWQREGWEQEQEQQSKREHERGGKEGEREKKKECERDWRRLEGTKI